MKKHSIFKKKKLKKKSSETTNDSKLKKKKDVNTFNLGVDPNIEKKKKSYDSIYNVQKKKKNNGSLVPKPPNVKRGMSMPKKDAFDMFDEINIKSGYRLDSKPKTKGRNYYVKDLHVDHIQLIKQILDHALLHGSNKGNGKRNWRSRRYKKKSKPQNPEDNDSVAVDHINMKLLELHNIKPKKIVRFLRKNAKKEGIQLFESKMNKRQWRLRYFNNKKPSSSSSSDDTSDSPKIGIKRKRSENENENKKEDTEESKIRIKKKRKIDNEYQLGWNNYSKGKKTSSSNNILSMRRRMDNNSFGNNSRVKSLFPPPGGNGVSRGPAVPKHRHFKKKTSKIQKWKRKDIKKK